MCLYLHMQDEQIKWMEAIKPGSSSSVRVAHYETVSLKVNEGSYSYVSVPKSPLPKRPSSTNLYDEPHSHFSQPVQSQLAEQFNDNTYDDIIPVASRKMDYTTQDHVKLSDHSNSRHKVVVNPMRQQDDLELRNECNNLKETIESLIDKGVQEDSEKLDQYHVQLKILDQMQRLVQRLEDASDVTKHPNLSQHTSASLSINELDNQSSTELAQNYSSESVESLQSSNLVLDKSEAHGMNEKEHNPSNPTSIVLGSSETKKYPDESNQIAELLEPHRAQEKCEQDKTTQNFSTTSQTEQTSETVTFPSPPTMFPKSPIKNIYENLENGVQKTSVQSCETVNSDVHFPMCGNEEAEPQQRVRAKLMVNGEYKSPVVRQKQLAIKLLEEEEKEASSDKDIISK